MKTIKQVIRQPVKTLAGFILITLAVAALIVCVGQMIAANNTQETLDNSFTTIALTTGKFQTSDQGTISFYKQELPDEIVAWLEQAAKENPHIVKQAAFPGLASAYIPELNPDNYTGHQINSGASINEHLQPEPDGAPYSCAMFEIELTDIGKPRQTSHVYQTGDGAFAFAPVGTWVELTGTIKQVIGLQEGFRDPSGFTAQMTLKLPDEESFEALKLRIGERYLVYGMDYYDLDWNLRCQLAQSSGDPLLDAFEAEFMYYLSDDAIAANKNTSAMFGNQFYDVAYYSDGSNYYAINNYQFEQYRCVKLSLEDKSVLVQYEWIKNTDGSTTPRLITERSCMDENGNTILVSDEEYQERYSVPTIAHLDGSVEAFLSSDEGAAWRTVLDIMRVNNHAFPIIGVDKLGYVAEFAKENAHIAEGRDFTPDELIAGAKVCILSETVAAANGINVGDIISPQFYNYDYSSPYQAFLESGVGTVNPSAYFYSATTPFNGTPEEYVVIGLYRQNNAWGSLDDNSFSFTPNTIFVPKSSVTSTMDYGEQAFFRTLVLENGTIDEWAQLVAQAGYDGLFAYYDQGYSVIAESFYDYRSIVDQAIRVGAVVYAVVLLLFILLFPARQGKALATMSSLGATRGQRMLHVIADSLGILILGTLSGIGVGILLWQQVSNTIMDSAGVILKLDMDIASLLFVAAIQFSCALLMVFVLAVFMTGNRNLMKRR